MPENDNNSNAFEKAARLYGELKGLEQNYRAVAPAAMMPKFAAKIAEEYGEDVAARTLLDPNVPDHLKIPFLEAGISRTRKKATEHITGNLEKILGEAPEEVIINALLRKGREEKAKTLKDYLDSHYDDKKEDEAIIKGALLELYLNVPKALDQRYAQIILEEHKSKEALAKYIAKMFETDEDKMAFFESLFSRGNGKED